MILMDSIHDNTEPCTVNTLFATGEHETLTCRCLPEGWRGEAVHQIVGLEIDSGKPDIMSRWFWKEFVGIAGSRMHLLMIQLEGLREGGLPYGAQ